MSAAQPAGLLLKVPPGAAGAGGSFRIDPERAQACMDGLRSVALDLLDAKSATKAMAFQPPADDAVSQNLAVQGRIMANRAGDYVQAWRDQIIQTADALEQQLAAYRAAEEHNRARLS